MKGLLHIVAGLFLVLGLMTGAMAHAAELSLGASVVASVDGCADFSKKSDDAPSDPAKASLKFHGCHGHHVGVPVGSAPEAAPIVKVQAVPAQISTSLPPPAFSDTFRPPIA